MSDQLVVEAATYVTHNKHKRRTTMPVAGLEPVILAIKRLKAYDLYHTATGIGCRYGRLRNHVPFSRQLQYIFPSTQL